MVQFMGPERAKGRESGADVSAHVGKGMYWRLPWASVTCSPVSL
jgi:hypothetical protein